MILTYKRGSRGEMVRQLQYALAGVGLRVITDGIYGDITEEAVKMFQSRNGLKADGIAGPLTLAKLLPARFKRSRRNITEIIVHCTATPEGMACNVNDIRKWHKQQGWSDIGYHYVVYLDGTVHVGRNIDTIGAHCKKHNTNSIGICYVGGTDKAGRSKDTRTEKQKAALLSVIYSMKMLYPQAAIYGHHDFDPRKDCPCFDAKKEYKRL